MVSTLAEQAPNVLLLVIDDLRIEFGAQGYDVSTPQIDRLAREGVRFSQAYTSWPVCAPSRASMMSGWTLNGRETASPTRRIMRTHHSFVTRLLEHFHLPMPLQRG